MDEATIESAGANAPGRIVLRGRPHSQSAHTRERDAAAATVAGSVGAFPGDVPALIWSHELTALRESPRSLRAHLGQDAEARRRALDGALSLAFVLAVPGPLRSDVQAHDRAGDAVICVAIGAAQT